MLNRYLFRGKRLDSGAWEQGHLSLMGDEKNGKLIPCIVSESHDVMFSVAVDPETIGQCTGRKFSGRLAFEGDYFHIPDEQRDIKIVWDDYMLAFLAEDIQDHEDIWLNEFGDDDMFWIGNIHDNPELPEEATHENQS